MVLFQMGCGLIQEHPNFASEQLIWITFYMFSVSATGLILNWSIIGCVLLVILFFNSAKFSEEISPKNTANMQIIKSQFLCF